MPSERVSTPNRRDLGIGLVLALLASVVFLNTLRGDFVYDDDKQIVENTYVQVPAYFGRALVSDVWAYKGGSGSVRARYWRPTFVAWLIANHMAFGLDTPPVGWHLGNVALHALVTLFAYLLLRRLLMPVALAAAGGLLFAVHPVHSETVAWISGSPDLLLAACLLGSLLLIARSVTQDGRVSLAVLAGAVVLYAVAQGAKEVAIFHAVLVALLVLAVDTTAEGRVRRALTTALPFGIVGAAYLIVRRVILGPGSGHVWGDGNPLVHVTTAPAIGVFYLRQMLLPIELGPSYPVRPVSGFGLTSFVVPALICLVATAWAVDEWRRGPRERFLLAFFVLLLAPAGNIRAFIYEQIVHDRYLYLPILGFIGVFLLSAHRFLDRWLEPRTQAILLGVALVGALPLTTQTWRYNRAWMSDLALWELGVRSDPISAFNRGQYAVALLKVGRTEEAMSTFDAAIDMNPNVTNMHIGRADAHYALKRYHEARGDLKTALELSAGSPGNFQRLQIYRRIARLYEAERMPRSAIAALEAAANEMPDRRAAISRDIAIMLVQDNRPDTALTLLESVRGEAATEASPEARQVLYLLGRLYEASGRGEEARAAWDDFLENTETMSDPLTRQTRRALEAER